MVAYSFKARFAEPIKARTKRQTIRAERKRHARIGETLQLYTGMRTRSCKLVGRAICLHVGGVRLDFTTRRVEFDTGTAITTPDDTDAFARADGFANWREMEAFWRENHPDVKVFSGVIIRWGDLLPEEAI